MALHKPMEFAQLCGVDAAYISVNKKRGKIILKDGSYDDKAEPNISFLKKCLEKKKEKLITQVNQGENSENNNSTSTKINKTKTVKNSEVESSGWNLTVEKKQLDIDGVKLANEILEEKLNKIRGDVIPFEMATQASTIAFRNAFVNFRDILEKRLNRWSSLFTPEQLTIERAETLKEINHAINLSIKESEASMLQIVLANSNKKEVGEREV
jgi:hypothetical protein